MVVPIQPIIVVSIFFSIPSFQLTRGKNREPLRTVDVCGDDRNIE